MVVKVSKICSGAISIYLKAYLRCRCVCWCARLRYTNCWFTQWLTLIHLNNLTLVFWYGIALNLRIWCHSYEYCDSWRRLCDIICPSGPKEISIIKFTLSRASFFTSKTLGAITCLRVAFLVLLLSLLFHCNREMQEKKAVCWIPRLMVVRVWIFCSSYFVHNAA